jgi:hypothetical protein
MATSFKTFNDQDSVVTRNLLHEAIPITGTIVSGTYCNKTGGEFNIKTYSHGMFQSVYDYPYLSSSANHIFDLTAGYSSKAAALSQSSAANYNMQPKKINIYNEMAQVLVGFDETNTLRQFDADGDFTGGDKMRACYFFNFTRLLSKDEIKKGSFSLVLGLGKGYNTGSYRQRITITDGSGSTSYKVNSPLMKIPCLEVTPKSALSTIRLVLLSSQLRFLSAVVSPAEAPSPPPVQIVKPCSK